MPELTVAVSHTFNQPPAHEAARSFPSGLNATPVPIPCAVRKTITSDLCEITPPGVPWLRKLPLFACHETAACVPPREERFPTAYSDPRCFPPAPLECGNLRRKRPAPVPPASRIAARHRSVRCGPQR